MLSSLLTSEQADVIRGLDGYYGGGYVPFDWEFNLPLSHVDGIVIPLHINKKFPKGFRPIILKGSRARMSDKWKQGDAACRRILVDRILRRFRFTHFAGDFFSKNDLVFFDAINKKIAASYPRSRYMVEPYRLTHYDYINGRRMYLTDNQRTYIRKLMQIANKL